MNRQSHGEGGYTIVELAVAIVVFAVVAMAFLGLFTALVNSSLVGKEKAVASSLATNQMEYLKSLPYDSLAVQGGAIVSASPLPATVTKKMDGITYTIHTEINYVDDAYDGCGTYNTPQLQADLCRNQPAPAGAPSPDQNPADYKIADVTVSGPSGSNLAEADTEIAARVAETKSTTGALFVQVLDASGNPISGATIHVTNTTTSPNVDVSDSSDSNGVSPFYSLPPDNGTDYTITASKSGYSTLTTIPPNGSLQPTYSNQKIIAQQSSFVTLTLKMQGTNSLIVETTDTNGTALPSAKVYIKGGYKKYSSTTDTSYYYDNMTPSDSRPTTDSSGLTTLTNLVPGPYYFCGDSGSTGCLVNGTTYYLAAAVPYGGSSPFSPVAVPTYDPSNPPSTTFDYNGTAFLQKVRLMLTTSSSFPRVTTLSPGTVSLGSDTVSSFSFTVTGANLTCESTASSCETTVKIAQGSNNYTASCTGTSSGPTAGKQLSCTANLTGITAGNTTMTISNGGGTLTLPGSPLIGGFIVTP